MGHLLDKKKEKSKSILEKKLKAAEDMARTKAINERSRLSGLQITPSSSMFDKEGQKGPGEDNIAGFGFDINPQVTFISSIVLMIFILLTLMFREQSSSIFNSGMAAITKYMGWFMILVVNIMIIAATYFAFSRLGKIRIGGKDAIPEFSTLSWYAMLLSAGMGIGLMFWSVGEPISHYMSPSPMFAGVVGGSPLAAQAAMGVTYFHWGLHPWAIYSIVGLGLAIFSFNRGLPLTVRSIFYPILGNKIYGFWGNLIDILSVLATIVGLATSLGFGVQQVNAGLHYLFGVEISVTVQVILIIVITLMATSSVVAGLDSGVKKLSQINMGLAGIFLLFLIIVGPTVYILSASIQNIGYYISKLPQLSLWTETFQKSNWQGSWTVFYWAWWISWSPFVGMFIARISKGRTVREFVVGVMIVPSFLSFIVLSIFGGSALYLQSNGIADISAAVKSDISTALFVMLKNYPLTDLLSIIGIILVVVFFVTSSDSGSLVVDHLTSGGKLDSPIPQRVFWAIMEGVVAAVLLLGGGLKTLQTATICTGLPFAIMLLFMIYSIYIGLTQEAFVEDAVKKRLDIVEEEHRFQEAIDLAVHDDALL
ncbi:MAG: BCCT family transporter [Bacteriovoracaceae bacterium]|nr:BCCT family transporter [Bacteriovoracaceae bacterium]